MRTLHDIAHCRAGDKGDTSILSLFPYDDADYPLLVREVTAARVRQHLAEHVRGGVTTSLAVDTHGKGLSSRLLSLAVSP